eukprot:375714-Hanusia_phi.AAC.1
MVRHPGATGQCHAAGSPGGRRSCHPGVTAAAGPGGPGPVGGSDRTLTVYTDRPEPGPYILGSPAAGPAGAARPAGNSESEPTRPWAAGVGPACAAPPRRARPPWHGQPHWRP